MKQCLFEIVSNRRLAPNVFEMVLRGDCSAVGAAPPPPPPRRASS